jgi:4-hydroxyphenylpyruvate dioxygenase
MSKTPVENPLQLQGIEFVEFTTNRPQVLDEIFTDFGFSYLMNLHGEIRFYQQNNIHFLLNLKSDGHAKQFQKKHGPSICAIGLRVQNAKIAYDLAIERGAQPARGDYDLPAIYGIGDSLIYFIDQLSSELYLSLGFNDAKDKRIVKDKGFLAIDHLTNNVEQGQMQYWADFYKNIFGFSEVRYFDIKGVKTGLISYALKSPCGTFCIPINEGTEAKSQINEYLEEYHGAGIQHLAFLTNDIVSSLDALKSNKIKTLTIDDEYYAEIFQKFPQVTESHAKIKKHNILIDGDEHGYLLQIFTKNLVGPIFIEIIQRKNHYSFGEGNFGALFRSIEKDQQQRGYLF